MASLVAQATDGSDPDVVIAALLHDAVEDAGVTGETIANKFGKHVADIVMDVTDDKFPAQGGTKASASHARTEQEPRGKLIKLADKTGNLRTIAASPAAG